MSEKEIKLNEVEQQKTKQLDMKVKEWTKKILLGVFCVVVILLMVVGLLSKVIFKTDEGESDSSSNTQAIVYILD